MSTAQNLAYSAIQVLHNFGAVATVGGSTAAMLAPPEARTKFARLAFAGWTTQAISGPAFGITSYYFYHRFPDIAGIAVVALTVKTVCVALGFLLTASWLVPCKACREHAGSNWVWAASAMLAATALTAAAFLRWFA